MAGLGAYLDVFLGFGRFPFRTFHSPAAGNAHRYSSNSANLKKQTLNRYSAIIIVDG